MYLFSRALQSQLALLFKVNFGKVFFLGNTLVLLIFKFLDHHPSFAFSLRQHFLLQQNCARQFVQCIYRSKLIIIANNYMQKNSVLMRIRLERPNHKFVESMTQELFHIHPTVWVCHRFLYHPCSHFHVSSITFAMFNFVINLK